MDGRRKHLGSEGRRVTPAEQARGGSLRVIGRLGVCGASGIWRGLARGRAE